MNKSIKVEIDRLLDMISSFPKSIESGHRELSETIISSEFKSLMNQKVSGLLKNVEIKTNSLNRTVKGLLDSLEWKTLNVGFFGETNVGKSTIIEALSCGDGSSIGDGRKDYTKEVIEREVYINGYKVKLIDMPGIEGNERYVQEKIKKAVNSCHIVFFMLNSGKEIERGTLEKLKSYLNERALVFGLINRRLNIQKLKYSTNLLDEDTIKTANRVHEQMRIALGNYYGGRVIVIDALLAFLGRGRLVRSLYSFNDKIAEFLYYKEKVLQILGKEEEVIKASRINSLISLLGEVCKMQELYILRYNASKIAKEMKDCVESIEREIDTFASSLSFSRKEYELLKDAAKEFRYTKTRIEQLIDDILRNVKNKVLEEGFNKIEAGEEQFSIDISKYIQPESGKIIEIVAMELDNFAKSLKRKLKWLNILNVNQKNTLLISLDNTINIKTSEWNPFWEGIKGGAMGALFGIGPIALFTTAAGIIINLFLSYEKIKEKRKQEFLDTLEQKFSLLKREIMNKVNPILNTIETKLNNTILLLEQEPKRIEGYVNSLKSKIKEVMHQVNSFADYIKT
ncbi:MAG: GTPase domain-containing protein [candidate division WOR-3 bacterium]|nr:GTPase domain-containing protein [candidate division WOR-3 bacterium]MDW8149981.1 GTPase domain-containing protein [candidate division WOR-3 bacterium]